MHVAGISGFGILILPGTKDPSQLIPLVTGQLPGLPYIFVLFFHPSETVHRPGLSKTYPYGFTMWPADVLMILRFYYNYIAQHSHEILKN
jgi:hypothetical protein